MKKFINEIMQLAEKNQISMEVIKWLPHFLKKELKRNSKCLDKERPFAVSKRC